MLGKILSTMISILVSTYVVCLIIFFFLHQEVRENISKLNYGTAEIVSTSGVLDKRTYDYLRDNVQKFGDYIIKLKLEKQVKPGIYDTFYEDSEILNKRLQVGDRVSIYLEDRNPTLFGRLINATVFIFSPNQLLDGNIKSIKTAVISKNAKDLVKGYDVAADIKNRLEDGELVVLVVTKLNPNGKYYGLDLGAYKHEPNPEYGDDDDEKADGVNYIFDNGDFLKQIEYTNGSMGKLVTYIQQ